MTEVGQMDLTLSAVITVQVDPLVIKVIIYPLNEVDLKIQNMGEYMCDPCSQSMMGRCSPPPCAF